MPLESTDIWYDDGEAHPPVPAAGAPAFRPQQDVAELAAINIPGLPVPGNLAFEGPLEPPPKVFPPRGRVVRDTIREFFDVTDIDRGLPAWDYTARPASPPDAPSRLPNPTEYHETYRDGVYPVLLPWDVPHYPPPPVVIDRGKHSHASEAAADKKAIEWDDQQFVPPALVVNPRRADSPVVLVPSDAAEVTAAAWLVNDIPLAPAPRRDYLPEHGPPLAFLIDVHLFVTALDSPPALPGAAPAARRLAYDDAPETFEVDRLVQVLNVGAATAGDVFLPGPLPYTRRVPPPEVLDIQFAGYPLPMDWSSDAHLRQLPPLTRRDAEPDLALFRSVSITVAGPYYVVEAAIYVPGAEAGEIESG